MMQIYRFFSEQLHAQALAESVACLLNSVLKQKGKAVLAVSGGRSPILFFQRLSRQKLAWECVTITLVDERIVFPDSELSNAGLVHKYLLCNDAQKAMFLPWIYQPENWSADLVNLQNRLPDIDIAVLGLGKDGHTASWLPGSKHLQDVLSENQTQSVLFIGTDVIADRLSLTLGALARVPHIYLQFSGCDKEKIFSEALSIKNKYPVEKVLPFVEKVFIHSVSSGFPPHVVMQKP